MTTRRKVIVHIGTSADGFIARTDGAVDWLDRPWPKDHYGMDEFMASVDTILLGARTYREAAGRGDEADPEDGEEDRSPLPT